jgi:cytoskeletal protein CcmA (bactofilin family)
MIMRRGNLGTLAELWDREDKFTALAGSPTGEVKRSGVHSNPATSGPLTGSGGFLSKEVEIKGSIVYQGELVIDGKVEGEICSTGILTIGENADVRGEIKTQAVTVFGAVHGNISVGGRCELKAQCIIQGDVSAAWLVIEEGATFIGKSAVGNGARMSASKRGRPEIVRQEPSVKEAATAIA